jgi:hypothetical protein
MTGERPRPGNEQDDDVEDEARDTQPNLHRHDPRRQSKRFMVLSYPAIMDAPAFVMVRLAGLFAQDGGPLVITETPCT